TETRQRHLSVDELVALVRHRQNRGVQVWLTGSQDDLNTYRSALLNGVQWVTSLSTHRLGGKTEYHNLGRLLWLANEADEVISMDTWLKTYTLLKGKPTKVVLNRVGGQYVNRCCNDSSDAIFLNPALWPAIQQVTVEELLG
ncbi:MAG: hypothetical protein ACREGR_01715, partial [Minisyncoccia bacterium]